MTGDATCVGVDLLDGYGLLRVFASGRVVAEMFAAAAGHFGDLTTIGRPPSAPIGGVRWSGSGKGYLIWQTDGIVHYFGDLADDERERAKCL